jgi:hypothetical protein
MSAGALPEPRRAFARQHIAPRVEFLRAIRDGSPGGYLSVHELDRMDASWAHATVNSRLGSEHRDFLITMTLHRAGLPMRDGYHVGCGSVHWLRPLTHDPR